MKFIEYCNGHNFANNEWILTILSLKWNYRCELYVGILDLRFYEIILLVKSNIIWCNYTTFQLNVIIKLNGKCSYKFAGILVLMFCITYKKFRNFYLTVFEKMPFYDLNSLFMTKYSTSEYSKTKR